MKALQQLDFQGLLTSLGFNGVQAAAIMASVIGRMAGESSESACYRWLTEQSAFGKLMDVDFANRPLMTLYRAADSSVQRFDQFGNC